MLVVEEALGTYHSPASSRIVINGGKSERLHETLVVGFKLHCRLRARGAGRKRFVEEDNVSTLPETLTTVEAWG